MKKFFSQNLNYIIIIVIYIIMFYVFGDLLSNIFSRLVTDEDSILFYRLLINLIIYLILIISCIVLLKKEIVTDFKILAKQDAMKIFWICIAGIGCSYLGNYAGSIISSIIGSVGDSANQSTIEELLFSRYSLAIIIMSVFIGPIVEELVFRKSLHSLLRNIKVPTWLIVIISSVLFGFIHVSSAGDIGYVFPYIFMGAALGGLEVFSKNIYPSIFVHIFLNALSTSLLIFMNQLGELIPMY